MQNYPYIKLTDDLALRIRHNGLSLEELQSIWFSTQNAILSEDGIDPISNKSWQELIDLDSWALRYLVDEVFANYDGGYISQYFYYDASDTSGKIFAGPVWDMDLTLGCNGFVWQTLSPYTLMASRPHIKFATDTPIFYALCQKELFKERMLTLYKTRLLPALTELLNTKMDVYSKKIKRAAEMDYIVWHNTEEKNYTDSVAFNHSYLEERIQFLNDLWIKNSEYHFVQVNASNYSAWAYFAVQPGQQLPDLIEREGWEWYDYDTNIPFDINQPIYNDYTIYLVPLADTVSTATK